MVITSIEQAKRDSERVNVFIEGKFWAGLDKNTLTEYKLFAGQEVDSHLLPSVLRTDQIRYLTRKLVKWWMTRPRATSELTRKSKRLLSKKAGSNDLDGDVLPAVFSRLAEMGYTDEAFTRWYVQERVRQSKYGQYKVQSELIGKGIDRNLAKSVIEELMPDSAGTSAAVLAKKFGVESLDDIKDIKMKAKAYRFLKSRGF